MRWLPLVLLLLPLPALAAASVDCSQTVGAAAAAVPFPASTAHGPPAPTVMLMICNAHASNSLGVNWLGGTASIGAQGTETLSPGGCIGFGPPSVPAAMSVIGSAASTTTACSYQ